MLKQRKPTKAFVFFFLALIASQAEAARIKDISNVRGVRENQLIGYGLVVGLNGTGDGKAEFTSKSFARMLDTIGVKLTNQDIESKNIAAVILTATLPPFARAGNKIDVTVNSVGGASSLRGGTLVQTPLRAADQQVYAVAQGSVLASSGGGQGASAEKGHLTAARIPGGAIIETDIGSDFATRKMFRLTLFEPDFTTAARVVKTINQDLGGKFATAKDSATIDLVVPFNYEGNAVEFMANIENLDVSNDTRARVVINERTGTVVIGQHVEIGTVAISHGNLSVQVKQPTASAPQAVVAQSQIQAAAQSGTPLVAPETGPKVAPQSAEAASPQQIRGPASISPAAMKAVAKAASPPAEISVSVSPTVQTPQTVAQNNSASSKETKGGQVALLKKSANVGDLVKALNSLGVTPKDLITILQSIKAAGALHGELEVL